MNFNNVKFETSFGVSAQLPKTDSVEIAFAGRSNVGKSSLINKVLGRKSLARVSSKPGKTVTVNFYRLDGLRLVDLPGYGYAKAAPGEKRRWAELMEGYFKTERDIRLVVQLIDMRHKPTADDMTMLSFLREMGYPFIIALTKCDKLNKTEFNARLESLETELAEYSDIVKIPCSSVKGDGIEAVKAEIEKVC